MSPYLVAPLLALVAVIQTTLLPRLVPGPVRPDLMLLLVLGWGVVHGNGQATLWGLAGGLFLDLFSGMPFGLHALSLGAVGLLADSLQTTFFRSNILVPLATTFVASLLFLTAQAAAMQTLGYPVNWVYFIPNIVFPTATLNTLLMPMVLWALRRLDRIVRPRLAV